MFKRTDEAGLLQQNVDALLKYGPSAMPAASCSSEHEGPSGLWPLSKTAMAELLARFLLQSWREDASALLIRYDEGRVQCIVKRMEHNMDALRLPWIVDVARFTATCAHIAGSNGAGQIRLRVRGKPVILSVRHVFQNGNGTLELDGWDGIPVRE